MYGNVRSQSKTDPGFELATRASPGSVSPHRLAPRLRFCRSRDVGTLPPPPRRRKDQWVCLVGGNGWILKSAAAISEVLINSWLAVWLQSAESNPNFPWGQHSESGSEVIPTVYTNTINALQLEALCTETGEVLRRVSFILYSRPPYPTCRPGQHRANLHVFCLRAVVVSTGGAKRLSCHLAVQSVSTLILIVM